MNMTWSQAILQSMKDIGTPTRAGDITQLILDKGYRTKVGATPKDTVFAQLIQLINKGQVERLEKGIYALSSDLKKEDGTQLVKSTTAPSTKEVTPNLDDSLDAIDNDDMPEGVINAFGMFWRRSEVDFDSAKPKLYGVQLNGGERINFGEQIGIYILYQGEKVVYVGRAVKNSLSNRLRNHTRDRLSARWDRFSWFGLKPVLSNGKLGRINLDGLSPELLVMSLEALLIEGLEPPQNRRRGDKLEDSEFIQETDPKIRKKRDRRIFDEIIGDRLD